MVNHFVGGCSFNKNIAFLEIFVNYFSFISLGICCPQRPRVQILSHRLSVKKPLIFEEPRVSGFSVCFDRRSTNAAPTICPSENGVLSFSLQSLGMTRETPIFGVLPDKLAKAVFQVFSVWAFSCVKFIWQIFCYMLFAVKAADRL